MVLIVITKKTIDTTYKYELSSYLCYFMYDLSNIDMRLRSHFCLR